MALRDYDAWAMNSEVHAEETGMLRWPDRNVPGYGGLPPRPFPFSSCVRDRHRQAETGTGSGSVRRTRVEPGRRRRPDSSISNATKGAETRTASGRRQLRVPRLCSCWRSRLMPRPRSCRRSRSMPCAGLTRFSLKGRLQGIHSAGSDRCVPGFRLSRLLFRSRRPWPKTFRLPFRRRSPKTGATARRSTSKKASSRARISTATAGRTSCWTMRRSSATGTSGRSAARSDADPGIRLSSKWRLCQGRR